MFSFPRLVQRYEDNATVGEGYSRPCSAHHSGEFRLGARRNTRAGAEHNLPQRPEEYLRAQDMAHFPGCIMEWLRRRLY